MQQLNTALIGGMAGVALAGSSAVGAMNELQFDWNSVQASAFDTSGGGAVAGFGGLSHTGFIEFAVDGNSGLLLFEDGSGSPSSYTGPATLSGRIDLVSGQVDGGSFSISVDGGLDVFSASVVSSSGMVNAGPVAGQFNIDGDIAGVSFTDGDYGGISVSSFLSGASGNLLAFDFTPNAGGVDSGADLDVFVVPSPASAALLGVSGVLAASRRRR